MCGARGFPIEKNPKNEFYTQIEHSLISYFFRVPTTTLYLINPLLPLFKILDG